LPSFLVSKFIEKLAANATSKKKFFQFLEKSPGKTNILLFPLPKYLFSLSWTTSRMTSAA